MQTQDLRFRRRAIRTPGEEQPKNNFALILTVATATVILPALAYTMMHPATVGSTVRQIARHVHMKSFRVAVVAARTTPTPQPTATPTSQASSTPSANATKEHDAAVAAHEAHLKHLHALALASAHLKKLASASQASDIAGAAANTSHPSSTGASLTTTSTGNQTVPAATATPANVALAPQQQPQADATPVYAPNIVIDARFTHEVQPDYPEIAKMQNAQGTAVVLATIGPNGKVIAARIDQSTGNKLLDAAALSAAKESGFQPPIIDGKPATETYRLVYTFAL